MQTNSFNANSAIDLLREGAFASVYTLDKKAVKKCWVKQAIQAYSLRNDIVVTEILNFVFDTSKPQTCFNKLLNWEIKKINTSQFYAAMTSVLAQEDGLRMYQACPKHLKGVFVVHMTANLVGALYQMHQIGLAHRDVKPNNVLCFVNANGSDLWERRHVQKHLCWGTEITCSVFSNLNFKLIDFGAAKFLSKKYKIFGSSLPCYENRRPKLEISHSARRPEPFMFFEKNYQKKICNPMRFGGVMPLMADLMHWFASSSVLLKNKKLDNWLLLCLSLAQWTEQRAFYLMKNDNVPHIIKPPIINSISAKIRVKYSMTLDNILAQAKAEGCCEPLNFEPKIIKLFLNEVFRPKTDIQQRKAFDCEKTFMLTKEQKNRASIFLNENYLKENKPQVWLRVSQLNRFIKSKRKTK